MLKRGFVLLLLIGLGASALLFWPGSKNDKIQIDITTGTNAHRVLDQLIEKGSLKSRIPFLIWTKLRSAGQKLKVGRYEFGRGRSAFWIVDDLVRGRTVKIKVVIPEGFASWQIAARLESSKICSADEFLEVVRRKKLEGFLYPATYELDLGLPADAVARVLQKEFERNWTTKLDARVRERGWTKLKAVTLASIIEREVRVRSELPLVSSLYNNRLRKGMPLEADPTVQYALGHWKSRLLYSDYRNTKSPYNTYLHKGFPPGPICSPGLDAITAALWPAESPYLYMVAKEDGLHNFSRTYREHVNKVNRRNRKKRQKR